MNFNKPQVGKRVELVHTADPYTNLKPGDQGTVQGIDDTGTYFVKWDNGSGLGLIPGVDEYRFIGEEEFDHE